MYSNFNLSFSELVEMANESTIQFRNLKLLLTEVYRFLNCLSPPITKCFKQMIALTIQEIQEY